MSGAANKYTLFFFILENNSLPSSIDKEIGFSEKTCFPFLRDFNEISKCDDGGVKFIMRSISLFSINSSTENLLILCSLENNSDFSESKSAQARTCNTFLFLFKPIIY